MLSVVLAAVVGVGLGLVLRMIFFSESGGASWVGALTIAFISLPIVSLGLGAFAQLYLGAIGFPPWIGSATAFFAGGLFYGVKRSATL